MANVIEGGEVGSSNLVQGKGTNSATFPMPASVPLLVESVVATVNNAAGGDTIATLTIKDQSGEVIAEKRQGAVIPAGDTGTATFALRDDDNDAVGTGAGFIKYDFLNSGDWLTVATTGQGGPTSSGVEFDVAKGDFAVFVDPVTGDTLRLSGGFLFFDANGGIFRFVNGSLFDVTATQFAVTTTQAWGVANNNDGVSGTTAGDVFVTIKAAHSLTVQDTLGNALFRVDANGDLHGKTGKALVFDL